MKHKAGLWLCRGTERRAHHNTEPQKRAAIRTNNSPSPLKSISSSQSYIPSVHFHPESQYSNLQTSWNTWFLQQQTGSSMVAGLSPSLFLRLQTALTWAGHQRADAKDAKSCRLCGGSTLAVLLLSLCRQPLSQDATHAGAFYSKQVYSRSHWLANCTCTTNYLNIT